MKILHVTQNYHPSVGGTQHTIKKISEVFAEVYHDDVTVLTSNSLFGPNRQKFEKISIRDETINNVKVRRFPFLRMHIPAIKFFAKVLKRIFRLPLPGFLFAPLTGPVSVGMFKAMMSTEADVIGASSIHYLFANYPAWRRFTAKPKPFVLYGALHLHDTNILNIYQKRIRSADYYLANTSYEKDYLVNLGFNADKIKVTGAGSDILSKADFSVTDDTLRTKYNASPGTLIITYIGRQEALKGIPVLINAFSSITAEVKICLFICGAEGSYTDELKKLIRGNNQIRLFSNVTDLEKTEILRLADILVLPSKEESFGVVFLEAWSFSKPVIGAAIGAIASLVEDGEDGLLFEPDNASSLADKLKALIQNEPLRKKLGANGNKKFRENYTWDVIAKKFRDVYQLAITDFNQRKLN